MFEIALPGHTFIISTIACDSNVYFSLAQAHEKAMLTMVAIVTTSPSVAVTAFAAANFSSTASSVYRTANRMAVPGVG